MAEVANSQTGKSTYRNSFRIGGVSVEVAGERSSDVALVPLLAPFQAKVDASDIAVHVQWVKNLSPSSGKRLFDSGTTWRLYTEDAGFQFDFIAAVFGECPIKKLTIDNQFSRATLQMNQECFAPGVNEAAPLAYPLDELLIMHRLTHEQAIELHGVGIVGPDGANNLFVGHSGAGKSTTARLWTELHKVEILSDDRIIVREDKVREDKVCQQTETTQIFMYGTPWHGEAHFALPQRAPLQRIFVLEHGHGNLLTRLTRSQAVAELFARSFVPFHRHEYVDHALSFLEKIASTIPCYRYSFEPDQRAVEKILQFHD